MMAYHDVRAVVQALYEHSNPQDFTLWVMICMSISQCEHCCPELCVDVLYIHSQCEQ